MIKAARRFGQLSPAPDGTPRVEILTFTQSFHGRTLAGISATAQEKIHEGFGPLLPGFTYLPFNDVAALEAAINPNTAGILFEPIQGEGGIHLATREFMEAAQRICDQHGILLMLDEVQCGLGRAGHLCGWKAVGGERLKPDLVGWAKGIAGGFPVGAAWISDATKRWGGEDQPLSKVLGSGSHGSTYGGSPLASAVALAVLKEIEGQGLPGHAIGMEARIRGHFAAGGAEFIRDLRGKGLMLGFVIDVDGLKARCSRFAASEGVLPSIFVMRQLMEAGLLTVPAGSDVVRWLPPLIVTESEIDEAWNLLTTTMKGLSQ
jgi:acetylornithine/succinyldiaminopimelate/putrescine aminotransferase